MFMIERNAIRFKYFAPYVLDLFRLIQMNCLFNALLKGEVNHFDGLL
jgi:hypothetical protein